MSKDVEEKWKLGDENKSGIYILPMLGFKDTQFCSKFTMPQCQFRNCFIGDNIRGTRNKILLVYEFSSTNSYRNFENTLRKHELFEEDYEFGSHHTVFIFRVPEYHKKDYDLIVLGKYSEVSKTYKDHIIDFHSFVADSDTFGVLYKTGKRKEQLEAIINEGLPKFYWTIIPPFIELEESFSELEVLQPENVNNDNKLIK